MTQFTDDAKAKRDNIIAKIRKMKAMTESRGASEAEALFAARKMAELIAEHNVSADELTLKEDANHCVEDMYYDMNGDNYAWNGALDIVGQIFKCKYYWVEKFDDPLDIGVKSRVVNHKFYGFPQDVEAAKVLTAIIHAGVIAETNKWIKSVKGGKRFWTKHLDTFHIGMAARMNDKLREMIPISIGRGLVVLKDQLVNDKFAQFCRDRGMHLTSAKPIGIGREDVYKSGLAAGANVDVGQSRVARPAIGAQS